MWLLDTTAVIHAIRDHPRSVRERLETISPDEIALSVITIAELAYGARRYAEPERRRRLFEAFVERFRVLDFDRVAAEAYGALRFELRHQPIGERDLLIAAIALSRDRVVVTANTREFDRVPGLMVEDWSG